MNKTMHWISLFVATIVYMANPPDSVSQGFQLKDGDLMVFLGDSITEAGGQPEGYVSLFKLFCDINGYEVQVINAGISGHKSNDMLARLQKDVLDHKPAWVSVCCGVNDVWHQFLPNHTGVPLEDYQKNMTELVDRCLQAGAKVLLLTATPIFEKLDSPENQKLRAYNEFLRRLASERNLVLCDLNKIMEEWYKQKRNDENLLTTDGVHMNPRGNRVMASEIIRALGASPRELNDAKPRWELVNNME
ncbi:MAG TPA: SGNH/GDSL hydrolase family protein [bacterium]|nr:SGNH/GDSL hydrolase family protein [bacterium]